ncbi:MAG: Rieske 2Fe-2S domain-containing protein [Rhodospirillales bacterium]|nr:Rieske 2Fe-2S domain-containing protein [Rhodospirillales bacterium]
MLKALKLSTIPGAPARGEILCRVDDIQDVTDGGAKGFRFGEGPDEVRIFLLRQGARVVAYLNACPHVLSPLNWVPDRFLDPTRTLIQCATHGAQFRIADGYCVAGPCAGKTLTAVPVEVVNGEVRVGE